jgi:hypothetical protein
MNIRNCMAAALGAAALAACNDDGPTFVNQGPQAYVRYVNASPDSPGNASTVGLTARFVDQVENWRTGDGVPFRGTSGAYQAVNAGTRQLRVFRLFNFAPGIDSATAVVLDTSLTLQPQTYYTIVQLGRTSQARGTGTNAGATAARVIMFTDTLPAPTAVTATQIQVRAYHLAEGVGNVDVAITSNAAGAATAATVSNLAFGARSAYVTVPALTGTALYTFAVRPAGTTAPLFSVTPNVPGLAAAAATATAPPLARTAGVRQGQSALSVFVFPAAIAGSPAATSSAVTAGAAATAGADLIADRQPPS